MSERLDYTVFRSEDWQQKEGEGVLEIRGGNLEIALFINGLPFIYDAADCEGSVGRFVALLSDGYSLEATHSITQAAARGFTDSLPLHQQIAPLLRLLPNGDYRLSLEQAPRGTQSFAGSDYAQPLGWKEGERPPTLRYYPNYGELSWQPLLLGTQPEDPLDDNTTNKYLSFIDAGERPALITVGARKHPARFVLDGHHKLFAYWCCGVMPHMLHIEFQQLTVISKPVAHNILDSVAHVARCYLKAKRG